MRCLRVLGPLRMWWREALLLAGLAALLLAAAAGNPTFLQHDVGMYNAILSSSGTTLQFTSATLTQALTDAGTSCGAKCALWLTQGLWTLTTDHTITRPLWVPYGTTVSIASGKTLTLTACPKIDAPGWLSPGTTGKVNITAPGCTVEVHKFATGGTGATSSTPYTGWDTALVWGQNMQYDFGPGYYNYSAAPAWNLHGLRLIGHGKVTLNYTGTGGYALQFSGVGMSDGLSQIHMENMTINAPGATEGLDLTVVYRSTFRQVRVRNVNGTAFVLRGCVLVTLESSGVFQGDDGELPLTVVPQNGIIIDAATDPGPPPVVHYSSAITLLNTVWEKINGYGIYIDHGENTYVFGGTSESNKTGITTTANALHNNVTHMDVEQNCTDNSTPATCITTALDLSENGFDNVYLNVFGGAHFQAGTGATGTQIVGGRYDDVVLASGAVSLNVTNAVFRHCLQGTGAPPPGPQVRLWNVWVSNPDASPALYVQHDEWCIGTSSAQMWSQTGSTVIDGRAVIKPQTVDFNAFAFVPQYNDHVLDIVGDALPMANRKGIVHLFNSGDLQQYFYLGIDNTGTSPGTGGVNGRIYLGGWKGSGTPAPMQGVWGSGAPSALRISSSSQSALNAIDADVGAMIWCPDCTKNSDPCTGGGAGTYAFKTSTAPAWRCL